LGETRRGKDHDKRIADEEGVKVPEGYEVYRDLGYLGHNPGDDLVMEIACGLHNLRTAMRIKNYEILE
jgi:hypothetical protein